VLTFYKFHWFAFSKEIFIKPFSVAVLYIFRHLYIFHTA